MNPETKFTRAGAVTIAYQVYGSGEHDLIVVPGWISNIEMFWEEPRVARFFRNLGRFSRVILFDKRGTGLSDRNTESATLEERMDDVRAVMEAVGSDRVALLGYSEGGPMSCLFSVTYPERTEALILIGSYATMKPKPGHPWGRSEEAQRAAQDDVMSKWGTTIGLEMRAPSMAADAQFQRWWSRYLRMSASPASAWALTNMNYEIEGLAVHIAARVTALASSGEVLVSRTVKDLVAGSGLSFVNSGEHVLKGIPDKWQLFAVTDGSTAG